MDGKQTNRDLPDSEGRENGRSAASQNVIQIGAGGDGKRHVSRSLLVQLMIVFSMW
jgi:hypothetical protein